jgi:glycosyltransferase involved in cell wall biosynthesis
MIRNVGTGAGTSMRDQRRRTGRRLLIVAPACDRTDVSEGALAYQWAVRLVARHQVTVLTYRKRDRASARDQLAEARFVEWQEWPLVGRAASLNNLLQPSYLGFYFHARRWIRQAIARGEQFDIVHQLTPMALRYPSPAAGLVPRLVVGPMAGALPTPPGFRVEMAASPWYTKLRALDQWRFRHDSVLRRSMAGASVLIGSAPYVRDVLADVPLAHFEVMCEVGVSELPPLPRRPDRPPGQLKGLFVGRIIRSKGVRDAIRALASLSGLPQVTLDVVGDGEDRSECEAEARALGVADRVRFHGWMPRAAVDRLYREADAFIFPSFREPTGIVIIEAMSYGLPVVAADYGGPAELVGADTGVRVPLVDPEHYATALAEAMRGLARDPQNRETMGAAARSRVQAQFLWSSKLEWLEALYDKLLEAS